MGWRRAATVPLALAALLTACAEPGPVALPSTPPPPALASPIPSAPTGTVRVAYPDQPATWHDVDGRDVGATDLAALWGLPLYELDAAGQLRAALVSNSTVGVPVTAGWAVDLDLRPGEWSDGTPVTSEDVARTLQVLAAGPRAAEFAGLREVETRGPTAVRLVFDRPTARWPYLLTGAPGVLPAAILDSDGLAAFEDGVPVAGGRFRLEELEPGRRALFVTHPGSPLAPPGVERVEVHFTPRVETAEGLLRNGRVDLLTGYVVGSEGAATLEGVTRATAVGGTWAALTWAPGGELGGRRLVRRTIAGALQTERFAEGLLGSTDLAATAPWPGVEGPWPAPQTGVDDVDVTTVLALPRWSRVIGFAGRAIQRDASISGATIELISEEAPDFLDLAVPSADGAVLVRRDPPRPALAAMVPADDAALAGELAAADAIGDPADDRVQTAFRRLQEAAWTTPLFRLGVAHAWGERLTGVSPSAWPGVAFTSAPEWRLEVP